MSAEIPATVPVDAAPTATEEAYTPHPAWEQALATVADPLRAPIYKQIQETEREHQKALEQARTGSVEPAWRDFTALAKEAGVSPQDLIASYNMVEEIRQDPQKFATDLSAEIASAVAAGKLTAREGQQAAAAGQAQLDAALGGGDDLKTEEQKQLDLLQQQVAGMSAAQQAQFEAQQESQREVLAQQYYTGFNQEIETAFTTAGFPNASGETKAAVMRMADSALSGDPTGTLTVAQAATAAVGALVAFRNMQAGAPAPASAAAVLGAPPVGGGTGIPITVPQKFDNTPEGKKARMAAMLEEGKRQLAAQ